MVNFQLRQEMAERLKSYITASPLWDKVCVTEGKDASINLAAFEDGKRRFISTLSEQIESIQSITPQEFAKTVNANWFCF